ncbi:MAG: methane monooxygenase/ammonia monooxygenase subunit C [Alicyclobacillaceae bacterium]|nr:methane monooxygenase/ammonia monooxygenase subunit C [Alicyclobacillaceae bacterium]MDI3327270.1 methane monooxygenase/ammonia monooxygenase subunit C [Alicyclobacillaceae bacterium]
MSAPSQATEALPKGDAAREREMKSAMRLWAFGAVFVAIAFSALRVYQQVFAFSAGMDSTDPAYKKYWTMLLFVEFIALAIIAVLWYPRLMKKPKEAPTPQIESGYIMKLWALLAIFTLTVFFQASFFAEQDAAWHQTVVRDTAFTPSHTVLFYGAFPAAILTMLATFLYARSHLPHVFFSRGFPVAFALMIAGVVAEMSWVAMNEWWHSGPYGTEEFFSTPGHWGFVTNAFLYAAIFSVWGMSAKRLIELGRSDKEADAA